MIPGGVPDSVGVAPVEGRDDLVVLWERHGPVVGFAIVHSHDRCPKCGNTHHSTKEGQS